MNQNLLKGIFILLVIMDHNDFARSVIRGFLQGFGFHVMGFMMIPFLRQAGPLDRRFMQYLFRLYYPFLLIATVMSVIVAFVTPVPALTQAGRWALALYSGNADIMKEATHMALLWFLPSFIALIVLRTCLENAAPWGKTAGVLAAWLVHPFIGSMAPAIQDYMPLGLLPALYVLPLAYLGIFLHRTYFQGLGTANALVQSTILFILVKACQMYFGYSNEIGFAAVAGADDWPALLCNDAEAVTGVLMVFQASRLPLGRLIEAFGQYSMQVYLLHAFVAFVVYRLALALALPSVSVPLAFALTLLATALLTLALAKAIMALPRIRQFVFPHSWQDLTQRPSAATVPAIPMQSADKADMVGGDKLQ
ncbi:acyltransferase family protein [Herbaspirillum huttiense]|uniref:acyltransferase family protein n=1 Tax=Herbaspirillum huttiense TaxID=863372 RepID=UPI003B3AB90D